MAKIKEIYRKRKGRAFLHDYRDYRGKRHRELIEVETRREAEEIASIVESKTAEIRRGLRPPPRKRTIWNDFEMRILTYYEKNRAWSTTKRVQDCLRNAKRVWKKDHLQDITIQDVENFNIERLKKVKPATIRLEFRTLKAVFNLAIKWKLIKENPISEVSLPRGPDLKVRRLKENEIVNLLKIVDDRGWQDIINVYLNTGARREELLPPKFTWDNVNFDARKITFHGKGGKTRWVPMNGTVIEILGRRKSEGNNLPFDFKHDTVSHKVKRYMIRAGISDASLHSIRKTFGSKLIESGTDIYTVSRLLGHYSVMVTERHYISLLDNKYHTAVGALDNSNKSTAK